MKCKYFGVYIETTWLDTGVVQTHEVAPNKPNDGQLEAIRHVEKCVTADARWNKVVGISQKVKII